MKLKSLGLIAEVIIAALIFTLLLLNLTGNIMFAVVEGKSMEPLLQTGDLVLVVKVPPNDIHVGDIVVYKRPGGELVIHRVLKIEKVGNEYMYFIKGDNNPLPDGDIPYSWILGKVAGIDGNVFKVPVLGYLTLGLKSILSK